jgi:hypothetical protein
MIGLLLLSSYCLFASIWQADFAKLHISFSFLNFPIFISEITMLLCLLICAWYIYAGKIQLSKRHYLLFVYLGGIALWAVYDYGKVGGSPLALRNAVLFFYPVFAFFAYCFYRPNFYFEKNVQMTMALCLIVACIVSETPFYNFIYLILFLVVLYSMAPGPWRYLLSAAALCLWPYHALFSGARTWFVSAILSGLFIIYIFAKYFLKLNTTRKLLIGVAAGIIFLFLGFHFADKVGIKTLITPMRVIQDYKEVKSEIRQKELSFHPDNLPVHLYNTEEDAQRSLSKIVFHNEQYLVNKYTPVLPQTDVLPQAPPREELSQTTISVQTPPKEELSQTAIPLRALPNQELTQSAIPVPVLPRPDPQAPIQQNHKPFTRDVTTAYNNIIFRLLIWEDMIRELGENKNIFGVGLGHPQRSRNIEILGWADTEWRRDGWITPHNSYLHLIYRGGVVGIGVIAAIFMILYGLIRDFVDRRSVKGVLLSGVIIYGLIAANFLLILELPYYAIPFWSIFGLTMAYRRDLLAASKIKT